MSSRRIGHLTIQLRAVALSCVVLFTSVLSLSQAPVPTPPPARQDNVHDNIHGVDIVDPYRWLEDQESPETRAWIEAQNAYTHSMLDKLPMLGSVSRRMDELIRQDSVSGGYQQGGYYFFYRKQADQDLWSVYRRKIGSTKDELLLDPHTLSPDHTTSVGLHGMTRDAKLALYEVRHGGEDEAEIHVLDMENHKDLPDVLPRENYSGTQWKKDKSGFFYGVYHRNSGSRIFFHSLGTDHKQDPEIFGSGFAVDDWISPLVSEDGRYLLAIVWTGWSKSQVFLKDLTQPDSKFVPLITGIEALFNVQFAGDFLIVKTNWKAPNGRIFRIDLKHSAQEQWKELVPEGKDAIEASTVIGGKIFASYTHNVISHISIFSLDGKALGEVPLPSGSSAWITGRWDQDEGFLYISSYTVPDSVYRYTVASGKQELWFRPSVPFDFANYESEQKWYPSKDGTQIPIFLVHKKGMKPDSKTPTILYGYGGFNVNISPGFGSLLAWWIEHGGLYAVANIRGGGEFGEAWHRAGMLDKKQNVFDDFIAGAEWLIANHYTNPDKLAIKGGSNGGLLVGAAMTQRPDLFRAVDCWHPDLDIVRYPRFKNNSPPSMLEYGNSDDPEQFKYIYAYSPYQHVKPQTRYPAVFFMSGDADTRVPPEQARKMTARVQAATISGLPVMLLYDTKGGHAGGKPLKKTIEDVALETSFLAWQLGLEQPKTPATH